MDYAMKLVSVDKNCHDIPIKLFDYSNPHVQGASCLARSLKVVNEALTSLDLGFNEIRVRINTVVYFFTDRLITSCTA